MWVYYVQLVVPLLVAASTQLGYRDGVQLHENFYVAVAAVIPVLLLALMVELASAVSLELHNQRTMESALELKGIATELADAEGRLTSGPTPLEQLPKLRKLQARLKEVTAEHEKARGTLGSMSGRIRRLVRCFFIQAAAGEAVALYALGAQRSSAFLVALCVMVLLMVTWNLWRVYEMRFEEPSPSVR
ncbi:MAG: hypothetical protein JWR63_1651 [Conexibacter sp.]|nr:hypothetical protein [Conexibacter sp.]